MEKMEITIEAVREFMEMLTGESLPEGMFMEFQPELQKSAAFSVIWYLQEHLRILPDNFEQCIVCLDIYDTHSEGYCISDDSSEEQWYKEIGISPEVLEQHQGAHFCSEVCEVDYWRDCSVVGVV